MANIRMKDIVYPGLDNIYTFADEAKDYSPTDTYKAGEYRIYDGKLYKCKQDIATAEAWTAAHWTETKIGYEVSELSTSFQNIEGAVLISPKNIISKKYISAVDGSETGNSTYSFFTVELTDFVKSIGIKTFIASTSTAAGLAFYDKYGAFISGADKTVLNQGLAIFSIPQNAVMVKVSCLTAQISDAGYYMESITETEYISSAIGDISVGSNLYDYRTKTVGYTINASTGEITENSNSLFSDYIAVKPSTKYALSNKYIQATGFMWVAYYTSTKQFISRITLTGSMPTVTTPNNCYYVRCGAQTATYDDDIMVLEGEYLPPKHIPYWRNYNGVRPETSVGDYDEFITRGILGSPVSHFPIYRFESNIEAPVSTTLDASDIYALYDALVSDYSSYITKTKIGAGSDGTDIYMYDFNPSNTRYNIEHKQKAILVSGCHGELVGVYCLYSALKTLCEDWENDETLGLLRLNSRYLVVPVLNSYAVDHAGQTDGGVNLGRINANGVNIARNFTCGWTLTSVGSDYSGTAPLSEPESQALENIFKLHSDANWFTSFHNYGTSGYACWHTDGMVYMNQISNEHIKRMSASYYKSGITPKTGDYFGYSDMAMPKGSEGYEALAYGIRSGIFEVCGSGNGETPWSSDAVTMGTEFDLNWMIMQYLAINTPNNDW